MRAGHEGRACDAGVVTGARRLEVRQVHRIIDVTEGVGIDEADLDRVLEEKVTDWPSSASRHVPIMPDGGLR